MSLLRIILKTDYFNKRNIQSKTMLNFNTLRDYCDFFLDIQ